MATETLDNLRTLIRDLGEYRAPQITDAMLLRWINLSLARFYDAMIDRDESRYITEYTETIISGTQSYALQANFYRLVGVDVADSSKQSGYVTLVRGDYRDRNVWMNRDKKGARFEVRGNALIIYPTPNWSGSVRYQYVRAVNPMVVGADTFDFVNYSQDLVAFDVAIRCAIRLDDDTTELIRERDRLDALLRGKTSRVDHSGPKTVRDVYSDSIYGDFAEDLPG